MKKFFIISAVVLAIALLYLNMGNQPQPLPANSKSAEILEPGPYKVRSQTLWLTDNKRKTAKNGDYEGADQRELEVFIWRPRKAPKEPQPLLIYSHGFMSTGKGGSYLAEHMASLGYTVAAATYPLTHMTAPGGPNPTDVVNQPGDISFIIDHLLNASGEYAAHIDASRIAAAGLSLGGMTTELAAYHPQTGDPRISAAVSIAGPSYLFSERFFETRDIPFMMVASPQDAIISYAENAANILDKIDGSVLVSIDGASHAGFASATKWLRWMDNPDSLGCGMLKDNENVTETKSWEDQVGTAEMGIIKMESPPMCVEETLPKTMNPLRQHQLNTLAVASFLQCHFSADAKVAEQNCAFLLNKFADEIPEVSVQLAN